MFFVPNFVVQLFLYPGVPIVISATIAVFSSFSNQDGEDQMARSPPSYIKPHYTLFTQVIVTLLGATIAMHHSQSLDFTFIRQVGFSMILAIACLVIPTNSIASTIDPAPEGFSCTTCLK